MLVLLYLIPKSFFRFIANNSVCGKPFSLLKFAYSDFRRFPKYAINRQSAMQYKI